MTRILGTMVICGTWLVLAGSAAGQDSMNAFGSYPYGFAAGLPTGTYTAGGLSTPSGYSYRPFSYSTFSVSRLTGPPVSYAGSLYAGGVSNHAPANYSAYSYSRSNYPAYGALGAYGYRTYSYRPGLFGPRGAGR